jgi:hypothetical protein
MVEGVKESMARLLTPPIKPVSLGAQVVPPSVLLDIPPLPPTYRIKGARGSMVIALRLPADGLVSVQFAPSSVLLKRRLPLTAYTVVGV